MKDDLFRRQHFRRRRRWRRLLDWHHTEKTELQDLSNQAKPSARNSRTDSENSVSLATAAVFIEGLHHLFVQRRTWRARFRWVGLLATVNEHRGSKFQNTHVPLCDETFLWKLVGNKGKQPHME